MDQDIAYRDFDPDIFVKERTAVIDGDSFAYAVGWNHKDDLFEDGVRKEVDDIIHDILQGTQSNHFVGVLSPKPNLIPVYAPEDMDMSNPNDYIDATPNFRKAITKSKPYKGQRKEKPEWYDRLAPVVEDQLITKWGFVRTQGGYEADDMVVTMCTVINSGGGIAICCGNDKDLRQWPGQHFNLRTKVLDTILPHQGMFNLYTQVIAGDSTDNIEGIPGWGPKAAEKQFILVNKPGILEQSFVGAALSGYCEAYQGDCDTAIQKFYENYMLVKLRTDLSLESYDEELIHGYDLELYKDYGKVDIPDRLSDNEEIPDFFKGE